MRNGLQTRGLNVFVVLAAGAIGLGLTGRADAADVLIDLGATNRTTATDALGRTWTNLNADTDLTGSPHTLLNTAGGDSGYRLTISNPPVATSAIGFNNANPDGTMTPAGDAAARGYPAS